MLQPDAEGTAPSAIRITNANRPSVTPQLKLVVRLLRATCAMVEWASPIASSACKRSWFLEHSDTSAQYTYLGTKYRQAEQRYMSITHRASPPLIIIGIP